MALAATFLVTGALLLPASASAAECPYAETRPQQLIYFLQKQGWYRTRDRRDFRVALRAALRHRARAEAAVLCLTNDERARHGLAPLTRNRALDRAASAHAFAATQLRWWVEGADPHVNPRTGSTPESRVRAEGYCPAPTAWSLGENAYWDTGARSTPAAAARWWMDPTRPDNGHRANILDPRKTQIGIAFMPAGAAPNAPREQVGTYVQVFGFCS